ncbi:MAG TPA: PAS domain-containing protein, partial [Methylophilaceae bacterium]|nr:PAS domain-containing protein [Methylophilaceae bacterium]
MATNLFKLFGKAFSGTKALENEVAEFYALKTEIDQSRCMIEYTPSGAILSVNQNWLGSLGYQAHEMVGKHHSSFLEKGGSDRELWQKLARGQNDAGEYRFVAKNGEVRWYQGYYCAIPNAEGTIVKAISCMTDITQGKKQAADYEGQIAAIGKAQGVIEFSLDGKIIGANANFLQVMGYGLNEIVGQHHGMFVEPGDRNKPEYRAFWEKLGRGEFDAGQYKRIAKGGKQVWLQASYNPIFDLSGKPFKIVEYAT